MEHLGGKASKFFVFFSFKYEPIISVSLKNPDLHPKWMPCEIWYKTDTIQLNYQKVLTLEFVRAEMLKEFDRFNSAIMTEFSFSECYYCCFIYVESASHKSIG